MWIISSQADASLKTCARASKSRNILAMEPALVLFIVFTWFIIARHRSHNLTSSSSKSHKIAQGKPDELNFYTSEVDLEGCARSWSAKQADIVQANECPKLLNEKLSRDFLLNVCLG